MPCAHIVQNKVNIDPAALSNPHPFPNHTTQPTPHKTAEAPPAQLLDATANRDSQQDEAFAFDRTVSRLMEMQVCWVWLLGGLGLLWLSVCFGRRG